MPPARGDPLIPAPPVSARSLADGFAPALESKQHRLLLQTRCSHPLTAIPLMPNRKALVDATAPTNTIPPNNSVLQTPHVLPGSSRNPRYDRVTRAAPGRMHAR